MLELLVGVKSRGVDVVKDSLLDRELLASVIQGGSGGLRCNRDYCENGYKFLELRFGFGCTIVDLHMAGTFLVRISA